MVWFLPVALVGWGASLLLCKMVGDRSKARAAYAELEELEADDQAWCAARRKVESEDNEHLIAGRPRLTLVEYLDRFPPADRLAVLNTDLVAQMLRDREGDRSSLMQTPLPTPPQSQPVQNSAGLV